MSQAFPSSTMPPDTSRPTRERSRSSGAVDTIRGFWRLLWIEFRRCGGYWLLALVLPLLWFMNQGRDAYGVVLWFRMSIVTFQSYVIIGPLTAGLTSWLVDRERRRRTGDLLATAPLQPFRRDLLLLTAAAGWGLVAYALVGAWYLGQGVLFATWGGPDLAWLAVGALAIVVHAALGFLIGRAIQVRFAPLIAVGLPIGFTIGVDMYRTTGFQQPLRPLSPFSLSLGYGEDSIGRMNEAYARDSLLWLAGLLGVTLAAIALIRHRSLIGMAVLSVSLGVATLGGHSLLDDGDRYGYRASQVLPFEWSCGTAPGVEVCLHPAYEARLDDVTTTMANLVAPIAGLPGVPTRWEQLGPTVDTGALEPGGTGALHALVDNALVFSLADELFATDRGDRTASQLVVITALAKRAGLSDPYPLAYGMPSEAWTTGSEGFSRPDESRMAALEAEIEAAVARFTALSPEAQRAWLEANWDALRAGELTLDDMP